tara:strand:+ start:77 stop:211 length:135 start_codon:yes stop_codon:yes gene_type:complete
MKKQTKTSKMILLATNLNELNLISCIKKKPSQKNEQKRAKEFTR